MDASALPLPVFIPSAVRDENPEFERLLQRLCTKLDEHGREAASVAAEEELKLRLAREKRMYMEALVVLREGLEGVLRDQSSALHGVSGRSRSPLRRGAWLTRTRPQRLEPLQRALSKAMAKRYIGPDPLTSVFGLSALDFEMDGAQTVGWSFAAAAAGRVVG